MSTALHSEFYIPSVRFGVSETIKLVPCSPNTTAT